MDIGIAFDLRSDFAVPAGAPVDALEEYDTRETIDAVARALAARGHRPRLCGGGRRFLENVLADPPELVFNLAEGWGTRSREAHVAAVCEMLGVPVTHSDPLTLALTLDKAATKRLVASHGMRTAPFAVVESMDDLAAIDLPFPLFVKPSCEGSSIGVRKSSRVRDADALAKEVARNLADYRQPVLVETFLAGAELTVGVLGNGAAARVIGVMEIEPQLVGPDEFVYGLESKRDWTAEVAYRIPPRNVDAKTVRDVETLALAAYRALGCRDVSRIDARLDAHGAPHFLEVNPLPGMSPVTGDLVILARACGLDYEDLIASIVDEAIARGPAPAPAARA